MRRVSIGCFTVLLLMLLILPGHAQNQQNSVALQAEPIVPVEMSRDRRLQKSVTLHVDAEPLTKVLEELSKANGISLHLEDKSLADLCLIAHTHPLPLVQILRRIAELYTLTWRVSDADPTASDKNSPTFVLYESRQNSKYIHRLQQLSWAAFFERRAKYARYASMSDDELKQLAEQGVAEAEFIRRPGVKDGLIIQSAITDGETVNLASGKTYDIRASDLAEPVRHAVENLLRKQQKKTEQEPVSLDGVKIQYALRGVGESANVIAFVALADNKFMASGLSGSSDTDFFTPKKRSQTYNEFPAVRLGMKRKVDEGMRVSGGKWADVLRIFCDKYDLNVFSDTYNHRANLDNHPYAPPLEVKAGVSLTELLNEGSNWGRVWWPVGGEGKDILFLNGEWYNKRQTSPFLTELLARLKKQLDNKIELSLDDLADLAQLAPSDYPKVKEALNIDCFDLQRNLLRFYGSLNKNEKQTLLKQGINIRDLSDAAREAIGDLLSSVPPIKDAEAKEIIIRLTTQDNVSYFHFSVNGESLPEEKDWFVGALPAGMRRFQ